MQQGTEEWFEVRRGKATASKIADIIATTKSGVSAGYKNYEAQLIAERLTGKVAASFSNSAMQWGTETEPEARLAYEFDTEQEIVEVAFVDHPTIAMSGASPDGLVGESGLIEIKCPNTATHITTILNGKIPKKYRTQMFWQMACTGRKWCDFVSFDPRLPADMSMVIIRLEHDEDIIKDMEKKVSAFLDGVDEKIIKLQEVFP